MQWDFQNKEKVGWTGKSSFVLEVPLRILRPSVVYSVPCDRIMQRASYLDLLISKLVIQLFLVHTRVGEMIFCCNFPVNVGITKHG